MGVIKDFVNLVKGMRITSKHLGRHAVTIQYPEERMEMFERSRGVVVLLSDKETGELNCTMCMLCMRACPTGAIQIDAPRDENKKRVLKSFVVDNSICCYCGLCEESCNFAAIKLANKYEFSSWEKGEHIWDVKKLQEVGRDVPYEPLPKKKPKPAAAKPAAKKPGDQKEADGKNEEKPEAKPKDVPSTVSESQPAGKEEQKPGEPKPAEKPKSADARVNPDSEEKQQSDAPKSEPPAGPGDDKDKRGEG
jgi:formate hydrogenlyase subunit 6/NADH:ubiquinone oxidoreductase subunit I